MNCNWYYHDGKTDRGPVSTEDIRILLKNGIIRQDTLVWQAGYEEGVPIKNISILANMSVPLQDQNRRAKPGDELFFRGFVVALLLLVCGGGVFVYKHVGVWMSYFSDAPTKAFLEERLTRRLGGNRITIHWSDSEYRYWAEMPVDNVIHKNEMSIGKSFESKGDYHIPVGKTVYPVEIHFHAERSLRMSYEDTIKDLRQTPADQIEGDVDRKMTKAVWLNGVKQLSREIIDDQLGEMHKDVIRYYYKDKNGFGWLYREISM